MGASGYSIAQVFDVPIGGATNNIIADKPGVKLVETSVVDIYLTRESVDVLFNVTIGGTNVFAQPGPANISTIGGSLPSTDNDKIITVIAQAGDEIIISASNQNVALQEARALVKVMPIDDAMLITAQKLRMNQ